MKRTFHRPGVAAPKHTLRRADAVPTKQQEEQIVVLRIRSRTCVLTDERGTATIEYLLILSLVTIGASFALVAMGPAVVEVFRARVIWLSLPFP